MASKTKRNSLLAHVADDLSKRELLATRSLAYILGSSDAARDALQELLRTGGADIGTIEQVANEVVGDNQERVDLVGYNNAGEERVLIEAKFGANLTENQPRSYLDRLPNDDKASVLLFLAPERRLHTLWPPLQRRAQEGDLNLEVADDANDLRTATIVGSNRHLMLTSWRTLLDAMESRAGLAGDGPSGEDIRQLRGLCDRDDADAFLPLRADELSSDVPRRLRDLARLVDEATARACAEGFANKKGLQAGGTQSYFGTYLRLGSEAKGVWAGAWFGVNYDRWREEDGCPLWIEFNFQTGGAMPYKEAEEKLGYGYGWIDLPTGKEYGDVLDSVVDDLRKHARRLAGEMDDDEWAKYMGEQTG